MGSTLRLAGIDWRTPKSGRSRSISLNAIVLQALRGYRHLRGEWVFCRDDGTRRTKDDFMLALKRIRKKAGLRHFQWHLLRHTFTSHLARQRVPLRVIQELLGHASISMTLRYAHVANEDQQSAVAVLEGMGTSLRQPDGNNKKTEVCGFGLN